MRGSSVQDLAELRGRDASHHPHFFVRRRLVEKVDADLPLTRDRRVEVGRSMVVAVEPEVAPRHIEAGDPWHRLSDDAGRSSEHAACIIPGEGEGRCHKSADPGCGRPDRG